MFSITDHQEIFDLISSIDLGWAKAIPAASFTDEADCLITFYTIDGRIFRLSYNPANTITLYHEVVGDDLDLFRTFYGEAA